MFYGVYEYDGEQHGGFYDSYEQWYKDTFCPDTKIIMAIDFTVHGKTYAERKEDVYNKAVDYSYTQGDVNMSWGELAEFTDYFETQGKRYGLLQEFRENGIC